MQIDRFKFAAASYLCFWLEVDKYFFGWHDLTHQNLNDFLIRYKVRRTIHDVDLTPFISTIKRQKQNRAPITEETVPTVVAKVCDDIKEKYKQPRTCLSAVSKVLWMVHGHPIAIYDNLARKGLARETGFGSSALGSYETYYDHWLRQFRAHEGEIRAAQKWLPKSALIERLQRFGVETKGDLCEAVKQSWFANRIFDQWLLAIGDGWFQKRSTLVKAAQILDPTEAG
jgi:hypothetical protein